MTWFRRRPDGGSDPDAGGDVGDGNDQVAEGQTDQEISELLDLDHRRASVSADGRMALEPGQVLNNIVDTMERIDLDIDTEVAIEDMASVEELTVMVQLRMGPLLTAHVVNNALRIMAARYPEELVRSPFPTVFELRKLVPLKLNDRDLDLAKAIFNRRTASPVDLTEDDLAEVDGLDTSAQLQVFMALFYMYGTKVGALKRRTGIE